MISEKNYIDLMVPFYSFVKKELRRANGNAYYGTGEAGHWAVQSNFNVAGGLAVLAETSLDIPFDKEEILETALGCFRYNLDTHVTGKGNKCSCGSQWGGAWITVLGLERMTAGELVLEKYLTPEEKESFRKLRAFEADWLTDNFEVVAGMEASSKRNKPESAMWNGSFLFRTAMDYPDLPRKNEYLEKSTALLLNAISHVLDAASEERFKGRPLREWNVGFNFTPNYSLDHHGYMNVGYSVVTLSHAAYLYFYCKARKWEFPSEARHNVEALWRVVKNFIAPDGRMIRIGGDSRARYCYCQMYLLPVLLMMEELYNDKESVRFEKGMLELLAEEQQNNPDGSFFGTRLADMSYQSRYYYTRLESDPFAALSTGADFRRRYGSAELPADFKAAPAVWHDDYHGADMVRSETTLRSMVRKGGEGPVALAMTLEDSSMAEWSGNGFSQFTGHKMGVENLFNYRKSFPGGFVNSGIAQAVENQPWGEGERPYPVYDVRSACAALPDGRSMIILEKSCCIKEHALASFVSMGWRVPNDVHNKCVRTFTWENGSVTLEKSSGKGVIDTGCRRLSVEGKLGFVLGYGADSFKIHAPVESLSVIKGFPAMTSLYVNEICGHVDKNEKHRNFPGDVLADTGYAVIAGATLEESRKYQLELFESTPELRAVKFTTPEGVWLFGANFSDQKIKWQGEELPAGHCRLVPYNS